MERKERSIRQRHPGARVELRDGQEIIFLPTRTRKSAGIVRSGTTPIGHTVSPTPSEKRVNASQALLRVGNVQETTSAGTSSPVSTADKSPEPQ